MDEQRKYATSLLYKERLQEARAEWRRRHATRTDEVKVSYSDYTGEDD